MASGVSGLFTGSPLRVVFPSVKRKGHEMRVFSRWRLRRKLEEGLAERQRIQGLLCVRTPWRHPEKGFQTQAAPLSKRKGCLVEIGCSVPPGEAKVSAPLLLTSWAGSQQVTR